MATTPGWKQRWQSQAAQASATAPSLAYAQHSLVEAAPSPLRQSRYLHCSASTSTAAPPAIHKLLPHGRWNSAIKRESIAQTSRGRKPLEEIDLNVPHNSGIRRSLGEIDFNVELQEEMDFELKTGFDHGFGASNANENAFDVGTDPDDQENVRRNEMSNDKRRQIFQDLLAKATNGKLKENETEEVYASFSVPIRTVQPIWKQGKSCLDQGVLVDVSSGKYKCGRKRVEVNLSVIRDLPFSSRTTLANVCAHLPLQDRKPICYPVSYGASRLYCMGLEYKQRGSLHSTSENCHCKLMLCQIKTFSAISHNRMVFFSFIWRCNSFFLLSLASKPKQLAPAAAHTHG